MQTDVFGIIFIFYPVEQKSIECIPVQIQQNSKRMLVSSLRFIYKYTNLLLFFVQGSLKIAILSLVVLGLGQVAVGLL